MTGQPLRESEREKERARQRDERNKACDQPTSLRQPVAWAGWAAKSPAPISFLCRKVCDSDAPPSRPSLPPICDSHIPRPPRPHSRSRVPILVGLSMGLRVSAFSNASSGKSKDACRGRPSGDHPGHIKTIEFGHIDAVNCFEQISDSDTPPT